MAASRLPRRGDDHVVCRFRVASRATGIRRQVEVLIYDDRLELIRADARDRCHPFDPDADLAGAVAIRSGVPWPRPDPGPVVVMRLWTGQLTDRTVAHESTHAAAAFFCMDSVAGRDTRARTVLIGDDEPLAYLIGDFTAAVIRNIKRSGLRAAHSTSVWPFGSVGMDRATSSIIRARAT